MGSAALLQDPRASGHTAHWRLYQRLARFGAGFNGCDCAR